jgi:hypothetical protein
MHVSRISAKVILVGRSVMPHHSADRGQSEVGRLLGQGDSLMRFRGEG